ncbi:hypothetical protein [Brevundimonas sp.]|uniref:hypothetical protein n=1 Tax=Brevundimonas sp. TaxID=1871086 RepID=UPI003D135DE9
MAMFLIGGGMGVAMTVYIQRRWELYSSSGTMTMVSMVMAAVLLLILGLTAARRYGWAWAATLILPPVLFFGALHLLERHPPAPPMG